MVLPKQTYFTTMTIQRWQPLFKDYPETNMIILDSLNYLVLEGKMKIFAFVIMKDHMHLLWQCLVSGEEESPIGGVKSVLLSFRSFTGGKFRRYLSHVDSEYLDLFVVSRQDRQHKFWKIGGSDQQIRNLEMFMTRLRYIHNNPSKDGPYKVVDDCNDYYFSSAHAYARQKSNFPFLTLLDLEGCWY